MMFRIIKTKVFNVDMFEVEVETYTKFFWFFGKVEWLPLEFTHPDLPKPGLGIFPSYHQALQAMLMDIEFKMNLNYLDL